MNNYFPKLNKSLDFWLSVIINLVLSITIIIFPKLAAKYFAVGLAIIAIIFAGQLIFEILQHKRALVDVLITIGIIVVAGFLLSRIINWEQFVNWVSGTFIFIGGLQRFINSLKADKDQPLDRKKYYFALAILICGIFLIIDPFSKTPANFMTIFGLTLLLISIGDLCFLRPIKK